MAEREKRKLFTTLLGAVAAIFSVPSIPDTLQYTCIR